GQSHDSSRAGHNDFPDCGRNHGRPRPKPPHAVAPHRRADRLTDSSQTSKLRGGRKVAPVSRPGPHISILRCGKAQLKPTSPNIRQNCKPVGNIFGLRAVKENSACFHDHAEDSSRKNRRHSRSTDDGCQQRRLQEELCAVSFPLFCCRFSRSPYPPKPPKRRPQPLPPRRPPPA